MKLPVTMSGGGMTLLDGDGKWLATCRDRVAASEIATVLNGGPAPMPAANGGTVIRSKALRERDSR